MTILGAYMIHTLYIYMQVSEYALGSRVDRVGSGPPVFSEKGLPLAVRLHGSGAPPLNGIAARGGAAAS